MFRGLLFSVALVAAAPIFDKPTLTTRVFPPMQISDIGRGGAEVLLTAELKGPETEEFYCPKVTWEFPDGTTASQEQDCPPFEKRNECWPEQPKDCGWTGFYRHPVTGALVDKVKECPCTIIGYPNIWRMRKGAPPHPKGEPWEVWVRLEKNKRLLARQPIRFWIK